MRLSVCYPQLSPGSLAQATDVGLLLDKSTDENLTSEDWGAIMEVCDRVMSDPNGPKEAVQSLIKRLAHRNANVQLYTLEVGSRLRRIQNLRHTNS